MNYESQFSQRGFICASTLDSEQLRPCQFFNFSFFCIELLGEGELLDRCTYYYHRRS